MTDAYKELHKSAEDLWYHFKDYADNINDSSMQSLLHELKEIVEYIESEREPRFVEDHIKPVQAELARLRATHTPLISPDDADTLYRGYEKLREHVRNLPNY